MLNFLAILYVVNKYEGIALNHWRFLFHENSNQKSKFAKLLNLLEQKQVRNAFCTLKEQFSGKISKKLLKIREKLWLNANER